MFNSPGRAGSFVRQPTGYRAFLPQPLPPADPPIEMTLARTRLLSDATLALGRLDGAAQLLPNPDLFVGMYVRREAVLSSQIEGTQASLTDVLVFEVEEDGNEHPVDVVEVVNHIQAMNHGLERLPTFPLSLHLIKEIHGILMKGASGQHRDPGEFRHTQNWIGPQGSTITTATYVPPPPQVLMDHLGDLEKFMYDESCPPLVRAGLVHAQFETIHPFLDGNGRVGRLLVTFMLCREGVLHRPLLYLSYFLKRNRAEYYDRLQAVRVSGRWEEWLDFFLLGVAETATEAWGTAQAILELQRRHRELLQTAGRASPTLLRVHDLLWRHPVITVPFLSRELQLTFAGANNVVRRLEGLGIVTESTGFQRNRRFAYADYLRLFEDGAAADRGNDARDAPAD
jgi:Fic family protein